MRSWTGICFIQCEQLLFIWKLTIRMLLTHESWFLDTGLINNRWLPLDRTPGPRHIHSSSSYYHYSISVYLVIIFNLVNNLWCKRLILIFHSKLTHKRCLARDDAIYLFRFGWHVMVYCVHLYCFCTIFDKYYLYYICSYYLYSILFLCLYLSLRNE